jgi:high-affinity K+ transport system ATPase subunit B
VGYVTTRLEDKSMGFNLGQLIGLISVSAGVLVLFGAFAGAYFFGKARAQSEALKSSSDPQLLARLTRVEQIVESTAVEVERISEGQRFTTRLLGEKRSVES